ncbi:MAG: hypothetical protein HZB56_18970 [Deltaproteobacteria bacterium]|nr:hypothetical protein [Deltaproteobacteria bacterium]
MDVRVCEKCNTPLDIEDECVTCAAEADGLKLLSRSGYASIKEMLELLEAQGVAAEVEQVPPRRPEEAHRPLWNLYAPADQLAQATGFLQKDWADMLGDGAAAQAAARGLAGVDLDAGGEIECPACGHRFTHPGGSAECPDCGLSLGAPSEAAPDEAEH